jgi:mono/diheme cytochrome c family protein
MRVHVKTAVMVAVLAVASSAAGAEPELGKNVYAQKCAACHGADGKGNAKMQEKLKVEIPKLTDRISKSDAELYQLLQEGKKPMPSFKRLTKEESDAVIGYVRSLSSVAGK